jgi:hypothetical protein
MLVFSGLPKSLWSKAISHAVYLKNQSSTRALNGKTFYKWFYGTKPNLQNLLEFGSKVWVHTTSGSKLNERSVIGQWLVLMKIAVVIRSIPLILVLCLFNAQSNSILEMLIFTYLKSY